MKRTSLVLLLLVNACAAKRIEEEDRLDENTKPGQLAAARSGNTSAMSGDMSAMMLQMQAMQAAMNRAQSDCEAILKHEPPLPEERALGHSRSVRFISNTGPLIADSKPAVTKELARIGFALARNSARPTLPWTFGVVESDKVLSFSGGGGYVLVTTGLVKACANEAQLAGVLAHAIAHVVQKADVAAYQRAQNMKCVAQAAMAASGNAQMAAVAADTKFSNSMVDSVEMTLSSLHLGSAEEDAYQTTAALMRSAGFPPDEYEKLLVALGDAGHEGWSSKDAGPRRAETFHRYRESMFSVPFTGKVAPMPAALRF